MAEWLERETEDLKVVSSNQGGVKYPKLRGRGFKSRWVFTLSYHIAKWPSGQAGRISDTAPETERTHNALATVHGIKKHAAYM